MGFGPNEGLGFLDLEEFINRGLLVREIFVRLEIAEKLQLNLGVERQWLVMKPALIHGVGGCSGRGLDKGFECFQEGRLPIGLFALAVLDGVCGKIKRGSVTQAIGQEGKNLKQLIA